MKVCLISFEYPPNSLVMGGAGTYAGFLAKGLEKLGVEVFTITTGEKTVRDQNTWRISVPNIEYWRRLFFIRLATGLLTGLNKKHNFDLVHFNEPYIVAQKHGLPAACTFHSTQLNELKLGLKGRSLKTVGSIVDVAVKNPTGYLCDIVTSHFVDRIICPSSGIARLLKYCFVSEKKISIVPNGIAIEEFDKIDVDCSLLDKYRLEKEAYVLYIGRLTSAKGVHYLIKAFQGIKQENEGPKLVIAGRGDFEPYLRKIAAGRGDILFVGHVDSIYVKKLLYENCQAVVVPSTYETFPMVVLEAMACAKPVIASNVGGIHLLVEHGKNGFLVEPKDVASLQSFIKMLNADQDLRRKMGAEGRKLVEKEFTADKMSRQTLRVYESLL